MMLSALSQDKMVDSFDEEMMHLALIEAEKAYSLEEVPVGAVIVDASNHLLASAHNLRETQKDATAHAEVVAIRTACTKLGSWRLLGCTLYVTLEPCPMCAGAIMMSRLSRVVYGASDNKMGACGSLFSILTTPELGSLPKVTAGVLEIESRKLLQLFFSKYRE